MKRTLIAGLLVIAMAGTAYASKPVVRDGTDYNGIANPGLCAIFEHPDRDFGELHVNCLRSEKAARIRYRFTRKAGYNGEFRPADVSVEIDRHAGPRDVEVRWMWPTPRTLRVRVPAGVYVHIVSVTWDQRTR
jgi:hypothetical protein